MKEYIRTFKEACTIAGDIFAQILIALLIFIPALLVTAGLGSLLSWVGLGNGGKARPWVGAIIFGSSYFAMIVTWLFSKYGAHPRFLSFCQKHRLLGAAIKRIVEVTSAGGALLIRAAKSTARLIEAAATLIEKIVEFIGKAIAAIFFAIVIGVILYFLFGAMATAPWWAIVIILLLLKK